MGKLISVWKSVLLKDMKTWIALLRGINVGGKHPVPMKELKTLMEANGFSMVKTYIQSGNLVFDSPERPRDEIELLIERTFGFRPLVLILSKEELLSAVEQCPYQSDRGNTIHYFFLEQPVQDPKLELLDPVKTDSEQYTLTERMFYLHAPQGIGRSKLFERIERALPSTRMTARNLNTVSKLVEMVNKQQ